MVYVCCTHGSEADVSCNRGIWLAYAGDEATADHLAALRGFELIAEAINVVVSIKYSGEGRRVEQCTLVRGRSACGGFAWRGLPDGRLDQREYCACPPKGLHVPQAVHNHVAAQPLRHRGKVQPLILQRGCRASLPD